MEPSIEVSKTSMDSTKPPALCDSFRSLPQKKCVYHQLLPQSLLYIYAFIGYDEIQALPPPRREGRSFPSVVLRV